MIIGRDPVPYLRQRGARQNSSAIILEIALAAPTSFQCQCRYCEAVEKNVLTNVVILCENPVSLVVFPNSLVLGGGQHWPELI